MKESKLRELESLFYPKSIAIVGASDKEDTFGYFWLRGLVEAGFAGPIYPINPGKQQILGLTAFGSLTEIAGPVDYVIVSTPPGEVLEVLGECALKGVKIVHVFTAGFAETGNQEGLMLEGRMLQKAREGRFRILGPNCIGVYCHSSRMPLCNTPELGEKGSIAYISQSGGHAQRLFDTGLQRGLHFNKIVSLGNSCDLDAVELMEYFGEDAEVRIVAAYLEGVENGRQFYESARRVAGEKPVVVWKGGTSAAGARAAASHTGSLTGSDSVWSAALVQAGIVRVFNLQELADTLLGFQNLASFKGRRVAFVAVTAAGGGVGVTASDCCVDAGLEIAPLGEETMNRLASFVDPVGQSIQNPLDIPFASTKPDNLWEVLASLAADRNVDVILMYQNVCGALRYCGKRVTVAANEVAMEFAKVSKKPFVVVSEPTLDTEDVVNINARLVKAGLCVFPTVERAARTISNLAWYWSTRSN